MSTVRQTRPMTADTLRAVLRRREPGTRLDLRGVQLAGLDLSGIDLVDVDLCDSELRDLELSGATLRDVDLTGTVLHEVRLDEVGLEDVVFGRRVRGRSAELSDVGFEGSHLERCSFARVRLDRCRFQDATLEHCDLRYSDVLATSFKGARLLRCDLYRSHLGPRTVFERADLTDCSLYLASFDGVVLPRSSIEGGRRPGLIQEHPRTLAELHAELAERGELAAGSGPRHQATAPLEAADIYRHLSGHWASTGSTRDAAWAYQRAKRLETRAWRPDRARRRRQAVRAAGVPARTTEGTRTEPPRSGDIGMVRAGLRWLGGLTAGAVAGHGERPLRVATTAVVWLGLLTIALWAGPQESRSFGEALLLACQAITTTAPTEALSSTEQALVTVGAAGGIALLGLFGFTLGNRLRHA